MKLTVKILAVFLVTGLTVLHSPNGCRGNTGFRKVAEDEPCGGGSESHDIGRKVFMVIGNKNNYWSEHNFLGVGATYQCDRLGIRRQFWMTDRQVCGYLSNGKATHAPIIVRHSYGNGFGGFVESATE